MINKKALTIVIAAMVFSFGLMAVVVAHSASWQKANHPAVCGSESVNNPEGHETILFKQPLGCGYNDTMVRQ